MNVLRQPGLRNVGVAVALAVATLETSGCSALVGSSSAQKVAAETELFGALGQKMNPCSDVPPIEGEGAAKPKIDPQACAAQAKNLRIGLLYDGADEVKAKSIVSILADTYPALTRGLGKITVQIAKFTPEAEAIVKAETCNPARVEESLEGRIAAHSPQVNASNDLVVVMTGKPFCGELYTTGKIHLRVGNRIIGLYSDDKKAHDADAEKRSAADLLHEIGHAVYGLGHVGKMWNAGFGEKTSNSLDLTKAIGANAWIEEYGEDTNIMGSGDEGLLPMQEKDISSKLGVAANNVRLLDDKPGAALAVPKTGREAIEIGNVYPGSVVDKGGNKTQLYDLYLVPNQVTPGDTGVAVYTLYFGRVLNHAKAYVKMTDLPLGVNGKGNITYIDGDGKSQRIELAVGAGTNGSIVATVR